MKDQLEHLKKTLHEIFQTDQSDLDFGIYRIMREKRGELDRYLEGPLLADLRQCFAKWQSQTSDELQKQINEAVNGAIALGFDPDQSPKVRELRAKLADIRHREGLEEGVLSDLVQFLRRYYKEGDFLSLPRYRKNSYAIEYNGEEVKLHWANADQYYVKTAERFRDYRFLLADGRAVHFKITAANTESGDNKAESGKERRFQLIDGEFMREDGGELAVFFRYEADAHKRKQAELNTEAARRILRESDGFLDWRKALGDPSPTPSNPNRTLLDKHLAEYTARNTFDYFIHKDLEGFLRRELDFYIKNEIVKLDDIEHEEAPRVELYLAKVRALRRVGHKLIAFLAQVENFQRKLFLKRKFVVRTDYCVTLDYVPRGLWPDVLANAAQIDEWRRLCAIDDIKADLFNGGGAPNEQFLEANQSLMVDTRHFSDDWKFKLLARFDDLDAVTDGVLIKSDNFHALNLLLEKYRESVKCIYIDPPYNTGGDDFMYKDGYQHSSWLSMMENRLGLARKLMQENGLLFSSIDEIEQTRLKFLLDQIFGNENFLSQIIWKKSYGGGAKVKHVVGLHEYLSCYSISKDCLPSIELPPDQEFRKYYTGKDEKFTSRGPYRTQPLATTSMDERPNLFFPIIWKGVEIFPEKQWQWSKERVEKALSNNELIISNQKGKWSVRYKQYLYDEEGKERGLKPFSVLDGPYTQEGTATLKDLFGTSPLQFPKPPELIKGILSYHHNDRESINLDFFAGSGTTAHAVINLNREDGGQRKYILVEANEYFDTILLPRIKKVVHAKEWKDGKPAKREGSSHVLKYFSLESYEDAMNNLKLKRTKEQEQGLFREFTPEFYEDYLLNYMLEFEARGSQSLFNLDNFAAPFDYRMKIAVNGVGETRETPIDLVETFNYLIGLNVRTVRHIDGFRVIRGTTRKGERCLIVWRTTKDLNPTIADKRLNDFLEKHDFGLGEVDTLYVNGDAAMPVGAARKETDTWQIKLIEAEFLRRMFEE